jgi:hypothetical protein
VGAEVAWQRYNLSFVVEEIKAEKWLKMEGEERRTEGNPAWWPLSKTGLLADKSRYGPQIQKKKGRTDPINRRQVQETNVMFGFFHTYIVSSLASLSVLSS